MLYKKIEYKSRASKIADAILIDMMESVNHLGGYYVEKELRNDEVRVIFREGQNRCTIITESAMENILPIINFYKLQYYGINYHIDFVSAEERVYPAVIVCIHWKKCKRT